MRSVVMPFSSRVAFLVVALLCLLSAKPMSVRADATGESAAESGEPIELPPELMEQLQAFASIPWQTGPVEGSIGSSAKITLPEGYQFVGAAGAQKLLELYGNPPDSSILAAVTPEAEDQDWTLIFSFDDIGYVKDDDKESLDADEIMQSFLDGMPYQNEQRREYGMEEVAGMEWAVEPFYNEQTNNLTWGLKIDFPSGSTVNYDIRLLGRRGVMQATLLDSPETLSQSIPVVDELLEGFAFTEGNRYGEWRSGDKVAQYGLAGLVAGGAAVAAAKTGLLAKLGLMLAKAGKLIVVVLVGGLVMLRSFFARLFGGATGNS